MKHWAYIGVALILGNACLLGRARAAELAPWYSLPEFRLFKMPLSMFWSKPQPVILAPVTVRLFSDQKLQALWVKHSTGFMVGDFKIQGNLFISIRDHKLSVFSGDHPEMTATSFILKPASDVPFELKAYGRRSQMDAR